MRFLHTKNITPKVLFVLINLLFGIGTQLQAEVTLPALFNDHMVLQQQSESTFWGWAEPGEEITISANWPGATEVLAVANAEGKWSTKVAIPEAGGPYKLTIQGENTITLEDVMLGEVWICSGQSNMEMPLQGWPGQPILTSEETINSADYPQIRLFTVTKKIALRPQKDVEGEWSRTTPETVKNFSATAFFFGRELHKKLEVPVGLIHSSWGGTPAEAWTSKEKLRELDLFENYLDKLEEVAPNIDEITKRYQQDLAQYHEDISSVKSENASLQFGENWQKMMVPSNWENNGFPNFDGIMWFRKEVNVPADWSGETLILELGPIDDKDITWFNGKKVGATQDDGSWMVSRSYKIPADLVKPGKNIIAVRVNDTGDNGGINGDQYQLKVYPASSPDKPLSIAGSWSFKEGARMPQPTFSQSPNGASVLYNGMIAPLIPYSIRGAIWYQGESNVGRASQYTRLFPGMINDWRQKWDQGNFPFYFVQIAPFRYAENGTQSAALRDAQRRTLPLTNTGMAVTLDVGNAVNIHPADKPTVGKRLSLWALENTYGKDVVHSGPLYKDMETDGNKIIISFDAVEGGLEAKNGTLKHFEIAGADGEFFQAKASIKGDKVVVWSEKVTNPQNVRYAWADVVLPTLFNKAGIPASSFTTEKTLSE